MSGLRVCVIGSSVNPVPTNVPWSGIESLVEYMVKGLVYLGVDTTLVSVEGSLWNNTKFDPQQVKNDFKQHPDKFHLVEVSNKTEEGGDLEKTFFLNYRDKIKDFDVIIDNSNGKLAKFANRKCIQVAHWLQHPHSMAYRNIVCLSNAHKDWTFRQYPHYGDPQWPGSKQPRVVYNGVDPDKFQFNDLRRSENYKNYLFLSVMGEHKGADTCLKIALEHPELNILFAGRTTEFSKKVEEASKSHPNVIFRGEVSHEDKRMWMRNSLALLQLAKPLDMSNPYYFLDIFPMTIVEANLSGTPVIAFPNGGVPEMVENGVNGFICNSVDEVVKTMASPCYLPDPRFCREYAVKRFNHIRMATDYLKLIEEVADGGEW